MNYMATLDIPVELGYTHEMKSHTKGIFETCWKRREKNGRELEKAN